MSLASISTAFTRFFCCTPIHISFWLLVKPSGWRQILDRMDLTLPTDFSLFTLTREQRKNRQLRLFLLRTYLQLLVLNLLLVAVILTLTGVPQNHLIESLVLTAGYTAIVPLVMAFTISVSSAVIFGGALGLGIGLLARRTSGIFIPLAISSGLTGNMLLVQSRSVSGRLKGREMIGVLTGVLAAWLLISGTRILISGEALSLQVGAPGALPLPVKFAVLLCLVAILGFTLINSMTLSFRARRKYVSVLLPGAIGGLMIGAAYYFFLTSSENSLLFLIGAGISGGMLMCLMFSSVWALADTVGGPHAAAAAASLVFSIGWVYLSPYIVVGYVFKTQDVLWAILITIAGLSFSVWRPLVLMPISLIWDNLLYTIDLRSNSRPLKYFPLHTAFWEEGQFLPWPGLEDYFLLQAVRDPQNFEKSKLLFAGSSQRRALQAAAIELVARQLEACEDISKIAGVWHSLEWKYLGSEITTVIRPFSQISHDLENSQNLSSGYQMRVALGRVREDLNLFQRELLLSRQKFASRFSTVAAQWTDVVENQFNLLAAMTNLHHEIGNPYICGMPLNNQQEVFIGRTDVMARLEGLLIGANLPPVHLFGQRRMGKTSLLLNLDHYLPSTVIGVFLDGQSLAGYQNASELFAYIIQRIQAEAQRLRGLTVPSYTLAENSRGFLSRAIRWIDETEAFLAQNNAYVLVMMDEFEALEALLANGSKESQEILGVMRFASQHRPHLKLLLVGSHSLDEIGGWSTFLFNAQVLKLGRLSEEETLRLVEHPVKDFMLQYEPSASQHILSLTRGHPHLVQSICYELVALKNEQPASQRFIVNLKDVEEAAGRSLLSSSFFFVDVRGAQLNPPTAAMLDYLASLGPDAALSRNDWAQRFPENFDANLALALKRDLIEERDGSFRFQVEMIRRWFAYRPF